MGWEKTGGETRRSWRRTRYERAERRKRRSVAREGRSLGEIGGGAREGAEPEEEPGGAGQGEAPGERPLRPVLPPPQPPLPSGRVLLASFRQLGRSPSRRSPGRRLWWPRPTRTPRVLLASCRRLPRPPGPAWSSFKPRTTTSCSRASARCGAAAAMAASSSDPVRLAARGHPGLGGAGGGRGGGAAGPLSLRRASGRRLRPWRAGTSEGARAVIIS